MRNAQKEKVSKLLEVKKLQDKLNMRALFVLLEHEVERLYRD